MGFDPILVEKAKAAGPTHGAAGTGILWTHVNVGEAVPGVVTPLTAAFWHHSHTHVPRLMYREMGVLRAHEVGAPFTPTNTPVQFLFGRMAANVDFLRFMADRLPGTSGAALEEQMLGSVRPEAMVHNDKSRYPFVAWGFAKLLVAMPRRVRALHGRTMQRWRAVANEIETASYERALEIFNWETSRGQEDVIGSHGLTALLSPAVWEPLAALVRRVGTEDDVLALSASLGGTEETEMMDHLWQLAQTGQGLDGFIHQFGFMGPDNGELQSRSWREDARSLQAACKAFEGGAARPAERQHEAQEEAAQRFADLAARTSLPMRAAFKLAAWLCRTYLPLREIGKACMIAHSDIGRMAARRVGALLAAEGKINDTEDVFFLVPDELTALPKNAHSLIEQRKAVREIYRALPVPDFYTSEDIPAIWARLGQHDDGETSIHGLGVSRGVVEGTARVVRGPEDFEGFTAGEILVCQTTDPGWAPVFTIAAAMVVDIGGMLSHSAIIARELKVPAVVNTRNGTRRIQTGQRLLVNGETGAVEVLDGALAEAEESRSGAGIDPRTQPDVGLGPALQVPLNVAGAVPLVQALDEKTYGGKAVSLARSLGSGLPIPPGLAFAHDAVIDDSLLPVLQHITGPVAVRSSGIGEDGAGSSFAGQHDTVLGVEGAEDILAALTRVAASAHAAHVQHYRRERGEEDAAPKIGIVVQQLVPSAKAGVIFTRDPVSGTDTRIIEAAWGLGEVVVASLVTPDHFKLDPATGKAIEVVPGHKNIMMDARGTHNVVEEAARALCLNDYELHQLNKLADTCEQVFGAPQDIEWAFAGGQLYLLQSRPITTG